jgi:hypothetical protein
VRVSRQDRDRDSETLLDLDSQVFVVDAKGQYAGRESHGPVGKSRRDLDHKHCMETVRPYRFRDAATLLLREKGVV